MSYAEAGFNSFFNRSIGSNDVQSLPSSSSSYTMGQSREVNYDNAPTSGSLGSKIQIGSSIVLDGNNERISIKDGTNEVVRIGELNG